jgi:hypothetical protein
MTTRRQKKRGGCIGNACKRTLKRFTNYFAPRFPVFRGPLESTTPPDDPAFYKKMLAYLESIKGTPEKILEASKKIIKFFKMTYLDEVPNVKAAIDNTAPFLNRNNNTVDASKESYHRLSVILKKIINDWNDEFPSQYSISHRWNPDIYELIQEAKQYKRQARNLVRASTTSKEGLEFIPGGEGPMSLVAESLTGERGTSPHYRTGLPRIHSIEAKTQLRQIKNRYNRIAEQLTV